MRYYSNTRGRLARRTLMATGAAALALGIATPAFASTAAPAHAPSGHLYWTVADEPLSGTGAGVIVKANLDGSSPQTLASGQNVPLGVAISPK